MIVSEQTLITVVSENKACFRFAAAEIRGKLANLTVRAIYGDPAERRDELLPLPFREELRIVLQAGGSGSEGYVYAERRWKTGAELVIRGGDSGILYGVMDWLHYYVVPDNGGYRLAEVDGLANAPLFPSRAAWTWDIHIVSNWREYIRNLARWKYNELIVWNEPFVVKHPDMIAYAGELGVKVTAGIGVNSYGTALNAPPELKRSSASEWCLCPSDRNNQAWMKQYLQETIVRMPGLNGVYFQTGNVDFPLCECGECREAGLTAVSAAVMQVAEAFAAVEETAPGLEVSIGFMNTETNRAVAAALPPGIKLLWEGEMSPGTLEEAETAVPLREEGGTGWLFRIYHAGGEALPVIQEMKARWPYRLRTWIRRAHACRIWSMTVLLETREWGERNMLLPALFAELCWEQSIANGRTFRERIGRLFADIQEHGFAENSCEQTTGAGQADIGVPAARHIAKVIRRKPARSMWIDWWRANLQADFLYAGESVVYSFYNPPRHTEIALTLKLVCGIGPHPGQRYDRENPINPGAWDSFFPDYPGHNPFDPPGEEDAEASYSHWRRFPILVTLDGIREFTFLAEWPVLEIRMKEKRIDALQPMEFAIPGLYYSGSELRVGIRLPADTDNYLAIGEISVVAQERIGTGELFVLGDVQE